MEDFLPLLKNAHISKIRNKTEATCESPFFVIDFDKNGNAFIRIVNSKLKDIFPDYHMFTGEVFNVLRSLDFIRQEKTASFFWNKEEEDNIYLRDNPYLLFQLLRCDNLIDSQGNSIKVNNNNSFINLVLVKSDDRISSSFQLKTCNGTSGDFRFLSDVFVLSDNVIYPVQSIGENFSMISFFVSSFHESMLETFLSVFYSYIENVQLEYEDYTLEMSDDELKTIPTIIFEKVDTDMCLYLILSQTIPGGDIENTSQFELLYQASVNVDHRITLRRISYFSVADKSKELYKQITSYSPNKQEAKKVFFEDSTFIVPEETATPFLLNGLPSLIREYQLIGTDNIKDYKVKSVKPKLNVSLSSGIDFLEGDADILLDDEKMSLEQFLSVYKKNRYITLSDGNRAVIDERYINRLERIFKNGKGKKKIKVSFFDLHEIEELMDSPAEGEVFKHHRSVYEGFNSLGKQRMSFSKVNADLRDYQKEGVKWINYLYENNLGGCLADDMGLGKTLQTIAMLARIYPGEKKSSLVVMPKSLLFNWQNELSRFAPKISFYTYYASERDMELAMKSDIILTTYAMVRNDIETFSKQEFHYVILDESQNIKNVSAMVTQAVFLLKAEHRLALSGTPIENNLTELYSLFRFLNPTMFGSLEDFNSAYTYPIQKNDDKDTLLSLRKKIFPFMLRRLKKDVLKELPDRIEQTLFVEMDKEQHGFYEERRKYYYRQIKQNIAEEGVQKSQFMMFQALNELRRIASVPESMSEGRIHSPKLDVLLDSLTEAVENGHKVVVFFNYIAGIELLGEKLDELGIYFTSMTGSTNDRKGVVERFQNDPTCKVLLMTLKTGGVGLNLTVADTVFIFEPWWNKAAEEQAINRLHRFGQTSKVLSFSIITKGSIEEKICQLQQQKAELFEGLIGSDSSSTKQLSEEDINFILG